MMVAKKMAKILSCLVGADKAMLSVEYSITDKILEQKEIFRRIMMNYNDVEGERLSFHHFNIFAFLAIQRYRYKIIDL